MNRFIVVLIAIVLLSNTKSAISQVKTEVSSCRLKPDLVKAQFAGNIGFISGGFGYYLMGGKMQSDIMLGYVPEAIANASILTVSQRNTFKSAKFLDNKTAPYSGFSVNVETGKNSFLFLPKNYPEGYYTTTAVTFSLFTGVSYLTKGFKNSSICAIEYYAELSTLATYLYYNFTSREFLNLDILSLALGINFVFN